MSQLPSSFAPVGFPGQRGTPGIPVSQFPAMRGGTTVGQGLNTPVTVWSSAPSNALITQGYVMKVWSTRSYHQNTKPGHMLFVKRSINPSQNDPKTIVGLTDFNEILRATYQSAVQGRMLESATGEFDPDSALDTMDQAPSVTELFYRGERQWGADRYASMMASQQTARARLKYLTADGILGEWNYLGVQINDMLDSRFRVVTVAHSGPVPLTNVFAESLSPRAPLSLILKRYYNRGSEEYEHFYVEPWTSPLSERDTPSMKELGYRDLSGRWQQGRLLPVGFVRHMGNAPADERKRVHAINAQSHPDVMPNQALGALPDMEAILTNPARKH